MKSAKRLATVLFVVLVLLVLPQPARAKTIKVGNGTAASCTEAALRNALTFAGGARSSVIQFKCGLQPVIIVVSATLTVPDGTAIDGAGLVTLDGQNAIALILRVERDTTVALRNLTLDRGEQQFLFRAGGGLLNEGTVTIYGCTFSRNEAGRGGAGGGIFNQGTLTVHDSTFSGNGANQGGGIFSQGTLTINGSTFTGNGSTFGAAIFAEGTLTVHDSVFDGNNPSRSLIAQQDLVVRTGFPSGAIDLGMGTHTITRSTITRNHADENGGGITNVGGTLTIKDSLISQNNAPFGAGISQNVPPFGTGIEGTLAVENSRISENGEARIGGGIFMGSGTATIKDSSITHNTASASGGGIANGGTLVVKGSTISENSEGSGGGGGGIYNQGTLAIKDSSIRENTAASVGGGIANGGTLAATDSTTSENIAGSDGGGIYTFAGGIPPRLINTLVTNNTPNDIAP